MSLYGGIDLHANNSVIVVINEQDEVIYRKRLPNALPTILEQLAPYHTEMEGLVVESTYNWYWLVDGLMEADYRVHLANPAAMQQYSGLKYSDDHSDARWLAHLLRLGVLPEGYIYPKAERAVRDLLRKRAHLVRQHTANVLSVQNIMARNTGARFSVKRIQELTKQELTTLLAEETQVLAVTSSLVVLDCLRHQIKTLEQTVHKRLHHTPSYEQLLTVQGIGTILAQTITVGNRRDQPLSQRGELCRVLPLCGQHEDQQWQAQRHGQCQKWQSVFGVGLYGGGAVCHALSAGRSALLPTQAGQEPQQHDPGTESRGP